MMPIIKSTTMRIGWRSGLGSLSSPRQKLTQQYKHALQGYHFTRCPTTPRMMHSIESMNKSTPRRFLTTGGVKSPKVKSNSTKEAVKSGTKESTSTPPPSSFPQFWKSYLQPKPMPERWSAAWYREMVLVCTVFAITGSSTMVLVRPAVSNGLGLKGSMKDGPWSFRICSLVVMTPIYATLLVLVGTVFGRHAYFRHFSVKMWSRFGIPPEMIDKSWHTTKKNFRKW